MSHVQKLLAAAALALTALAAPQAANADFIVNLDNYATNDALDWAGTNNTISVCVHWKALDLFCQKVGAKVLSTRTNHEFIWTGHETAADVALIEVTTSGNNVFWLDQIKLLNGDRSGYYNRGIDNTTGWCFSTPTTAGVPVNCSPKKFATTWIFPTDNSEPRSR